MKWAIPVAIMSFCALGAGSGGHGAEAKNFRFLKPEGLQNSSSYRQAVVVDKGKLVILAGQMPVDEKGRLVGEGDFKAKRQGRSRTSCWR